MCESCRSRQTPARRPKISPSDCAALIRWARSTIASRSRPWKPECVVVLHQVLADLIEHLLATPPIDADRLRRGRQRQRERENGGTGRTGQAAGHHAAVILSNRRTPRRVAGTRPGALTGRHVHPIAAISYCAIVTAREPTTRRSRRRHARIVLPLPRDTFQILVSLADRERHGYSVMQESPNAPAARSASARAPSTPRSNDCCRRG